MNFIYLFFPTIIVLFFVAYIFSGKDILSPSVMMTIMFIISTTFVMLNVGNWKLQYSFDAYMITVTGIFTFIFGQMIGQSISRKKIYSSQALTEGITPIVIQHWKLLFLIVINAAIVFLYYREIARIMGSFSNVTLMFAAYRRQGVANLAGEEGEVVSGFLNSAQRIVTASMYVSGYVLVNNIVSKHKDFKGKLYLTCLFLISLIPGIMSGSRSYYLKIASAVLIYFYVSIHQKKGWNINLSWKFIRIGLVSLIIGIYAFFYGMTLIGRDNSSLKLLDYVSEYLGGGIALFSEYLKNPTSRELLGEESLFGVLKVLNFLGLSAKPTDYNLEFRTVGKLRSNVYSFFRRPLHDFGLFGMYVFVILIGIFFGYLYYSKIKYRQQNKRTEHWTIIYGYLYYWVVVSPIDQYSVGYIAVGTVIILAIAIIIYDFLSSNRIKIGGIHI